MTIIRIIDRLLARIDNTIRTRFQADNTQSYIAMFHNVVENDDTITDRYTCTKEQFENYVVKSINSGIQFVSIDNLLNNYSKFGKCVLTFDDGFESIYTTIYPIIRKYNIPILIYVTGEFIDKHNYLTSTQLIELSTSPFCTIGMHAYCHVKYRYVGVTDLRDDFFKCKGILLKLLNVDIKHYAFPYGSFLAVSELNIKTIKQCGVCSVSLTRPRKLTKWDIRNRYHLPRVNVPMVWHELKIF